MITIEQAKILRFHIQDKAKSLDDYVTASRYHADHGDEYDKLHQADINLEEFINSITETNSTSEPDLTGGHEFVNTGGEYARAEQIICKSCGKNARNCDLVCPGDNATNIDTPAIIRAECAAMVEAYADQVDEYETKDNRLSELAKAMREGKPFVWNYPDD